MTPASDFLPLGLRSGVGEKVPRTHLPAAPWPNRRPDQLTVLIVDAGADGGRVDVDYHVREITERFRTVISRSRDD